MRPRILVSLVALVLPAALSAQRIPLPGILRRGPARGTPLPPQPEPIAREIAYRRWRLSVESYPMVSRIESPGLSGVRAIPAWTTFGMGTHAEYLLMRNMSASLDMTSSFLGGPAITNTVEVGTRLHPEWAEHKFYPFVDMRVGYLTAYDRGLGTFNDIYGDPSLQRSTIRYSRGFGAIGGAGLEYAITRSWTATTSASVLRSEMTARDFDVPPPHTQFGLTSFRYILGVRYNPVRSMRSPGASH